MSAAAWPLNSSSPHTIRNPLMPITVPPSAESQGEAGGWPARMEQFSPTRSCYPGIAHIRAAEADIGDIGFVRHLVELDLACSGVDYADAATHQRGHADAPVGLNGEAVQQLIV